MIASHVHPDHLFGHAAFAGDRPAFVGHAKLPAALAARGAYYLDHLRRDLGPVAEGTRVVPPTLLVEDRLELDLGGRRSCSRPSRPRIPTTIFACSTPTGRSGSPTSCSWSACR